MHNLHRELAPISEAAWADLEEEATRTFKRHIAGRRVVDVSGPHGPDYTAVGTGHLAAVDGPAAGVTSLLFETQPLVQLRVPFTLSRDAVDSVERGAQDADWDPLKDAAKQIAFAEDRAVFDGYPAARIEGIRGSSSNTAVATPGEATEVPTAISQALSQLRLAGVDGPYSVVLGAELYTLVSEVSDHGYPILSHIARLVDGDLIWAPAISGAVVLSTRGGDYDLRIGQDLSIGYLEHDADTVTLYFQESLTFLPYTAEASVDLTA